MFTYKLEIQWIDSTLSHWMSCSGLLDSKYQVPTVLYCIIEMLLSEMRNTWQPDNLTTWQPTILTFWLSRSAQDNPHTSYFIDFWSVSGHCIIATNCTMSDFLIWMTREERREVFHYLSYSPSSLAEVKVRRRRPRPSTSTLPSDLILSLCYHSRLNMMVWCNYLELSICCHQPVDTGTHQY